MKLPSLPRLVAILLATGGAIWALLLLLAAAKTGWSFVFQHFGLGFAVWAGWIARAAMALRLGLRCAIWVASIGVNGWWLLQMLLSRVNEPLIPTSWWAATVLLSLIALATERR